MKSPFPPPVSSRMRGPIFHSPYANPFAVDPAPIPTPLRHPPPRLTTQPSPPTIDNSPKPIPSIILTLYAL